MSISVKVSLDKQLENFMKKGLHIYGIRLEEEMKDFLRTELQIIADRALNAMRSFITINSKNPTGRLERALTVEYRENRNSISFGIGDKDKLNDEAEYWYVLNYGVKFRSGVKFIPGDFIGYVNDGGPIAGETNKAGDVWNRNAKGGHLFQPKEFTSVPYISVGVSTIKQGMRDLHHKIKEFNRTKNYLSKMSKLNPQA
ncbi:MAG: hypothetical protein BWY21_01756 [Parcubacteria group bacterium ADurb.Bin216]|nr:MAG: hypothetical protein BWY21_01756 [Parcubacteria group bacterium ADurb.Bin216]